MSFDYVIVGGGSAGCVLANRLTADPSCRVLLLEAGGAARGLWPRMPAGTARMFNRGPYNWGFTSEAEPHLNGRTIYAPRGRGLGGSSLINGMVFLRGQPEDYDGWSEFGVRGWGWSDVLPHFRRIEAREGGDALLRGRDGEVRVTDAKYRHPAAADFVSACEQAGIPASDDLNGAAPCSGAGWLQFNIWRGQRLSAAGAFLAPLRNRPNLVVRSGALASRVLVEQGQAAGVEYRDAAGSRQLARARREVILCGGAFGSPQVLLRSGIGPGRQLQDLGIPVHADLPGVGENLQDHFYIHSVFATTRASSLNLDFRCWRSLAHGAMYLLTQQGPLATGASHAVAFMRCLQQSDRPDTQINFKPFTWERHPDGSVRIKRSNEFSAASCYLRPASRGAIRLRSADPAQDPVIRPNYLDAAQDQQAALAALRLARGIFAQPALRHRVTRELLPGIERQDDAALLAYVRQHGASMHHWVGSCRMGTDPMAVVDERLRVRGVGRLRVVDASVMPRIPSANTHAPTLMLADRAAHLILQDARSAACVHPVPSPTGLTATGTA